MNLQLNHNFSSPSDFTALTYNMKKVIKKEIMANICWFSIEDSETAVSSSSEQKMPCYL